MRLSQRIKDKLYKAVLNSFGDVPVYLFGSRVDNAAVGGDIDLAIDVELERTQFRRKKAIFGAQLIRLGFTEIEVDVVSYKPKDELLAKEIKNTAIRLF